MVIFKDLRINIQVNDHDLSEYDDNDEEVNGKVVSKYIEASSGENFAIKIVVLNSYSFTSGALSFVVCVDGLWIEAPITKQNDRLRWGTRIVSGKKTKEHDGWKFRPLTFTDITPVENPGSEAEKCKEKLRALNLGVVMIKVYRKEILAGHRAPDGNEWTTKDTISELAKKEVCRHSLTHGTKLGEAKDTDAPVVLRTECLDDGLPFTTFKFKYRSKEALRNLLVIPRTPSPVPLEDRPAEDLTLEEARELLRRQRQILSRVKSEPGSEGYRRLKREHVDDYEDLAGEGLGQRSKARPFVNGEVIELDK